MCRPRTGLPRRLSWRHPGGGYPGGYPGSSGAWVPSDANGSPLPSSDRRLNSDGSAYLSPSGKKPTLRNTYPFPDTAAQWWFNAFSPNKYNLNCDPNPEYGPPSLSLNGCAGNTTTDDYGFGPVCFYDPSNHADDRPDSAPLPPDLLGSAHGDTRDTLTAYFVWTGSDSPPAPADFIVHTSLSASAFVSKTGGLSAMASLGGDSVTATAGDAGSCSSQAKSSYHVVQATVSGVVAQVPMSGSVSVDSSNSLPYASWIPGDHDFYYTGPGNGSTSASDSATAIATAFPADLRGHSTVDSANWDARKPLFFSGTNCSVVGTGQAVNSYVQQAVLLIGGTPVKFYFDTAYYGPYPPGSTFGTNQTSVSLTVNFDSTHFTNGNPIPIQMTTTDMMGKSYTANVSSPACNNLLAVANQTSSAVDPTTGENVAINAANGSAKGQKGQPSYQPYPGVMTQSSPNNISAVGIFYHHKGDLINDIATSGYTVFFATTHADPGALGDCYSVSDSDPAYDPGAYLHDADIKGAITTRTTALSAPYLFAYLYGCNGASDPTTIAADFGFSQTSSDDRAFLGYAAPVAVTQQNTNFAVQVWHDLMQGQTLDAATSEAAREYHIQPWPDHNSNTTTVIWGDPNMTLHGEVYNWVSGPTWYR